MNIAFWKFAVFVGLIAFIGYLLFPGDKLLTEMFMDNFDYEQAKPHLELAYERNPLDTRALRNMARYYEILGKSKEQLEIYEKLIVLLPKNIEFRYQLAKLYRWNNQPIRELEQLEAIEKMTPSDPNLMLRLIDFYSWRKETQKASEIMKRLITIEPWNPHHYVRLADDYIRLKKYDEAIHVYEDLIKNYKKNDLQYHLELSDLYEWQLKNDRGIRLLLSGLSRKWKYKVYAPPKLRLAKKIDSEDWAALERLQVHYFNLKEFDKSRSLYETMIKRESNRLSLREDYANFLWKINDITSAISQFEIIIQKEPKNLKYLGELADLYASINDLSKSITYYLKALDIDPTHAPTVIALSQIYIWMEESERAIPLLLALPDREKNPDVIASLADAYFYAGTHTKAITLYQKLVTLYPDRKEYQMHLADAYLYSGQVAQATPMYLKLLARYPNDRLFHVRLGEAFISGGRLESGIELLKQELELNPHDADTCFLIASAYQSLGWKGEAERYYEKTLKIISVDHVRTPQSQTPQKITKMEIAQKKMHRDLLRAKTMLQLSSSLDGLNILQQLYKKNRNNKEIHLAYAYALIQHRQYERAFHILYPLSQTLDEPEVYRAMGSLYDDVGDPYSSSKYYEKVLKTVPSDKNALLSLAFSYQNLHRPLDALTLSEKLKSDHPDWASVRQLDEGLKVNIAPKLSSEGYFTHLRSGEMIRYEQTHGEYQLTNRLRFLGDVRLGNYRFLGSHIDEHIATLDMGANYFWNTLTQTRFSLRQFIGSPTYTIAVKLNQDFHFFEGTQHTATLSAMSYLHDLWLDPIKTIPHKGTQNIWDLTYAQNLFKDYIFTKSSATIQKSELAHHITATERTFEGTLGVRLLRSNPRLIFNYRYFRNNPTVKTRNNGPLQEIIGLNPITQHHYIGDLQVTGPLRVTLFGSTTWSGNKNQKEANIFKNDRSLIGWTTGIYWPMTQQFRLTGNIGNSAAGSEGGIANKAAKVYYGQIEYNFF